MRQQKEKWKQKGEMLKKKKRMKVNLNIFLIICYHLMICCLVFE